MTQSGLFRPVKIHTSRSPVGTLTQYLPAQALSYYLSQFGISTNHYDLNECTTHCARAYYATPAPKNWNEEQ
eukprot:11188031-Lingulodinium_polyedra.AAC.1